MANASNNGFLPITNQGQQNNGAYSQVNPMFGAYYNVSQAPSGSSVLGYNMSAGSVMPYATTGTNTGTSATPTAPTGGTMAAGYNSATGTTGNSSGTSNPSSSISSSYAAIPSASNSAATGGSNTYSAANIAANNQQQPVAAQPQVSQAPAQPKYSPNGVLAAPNSHVIPAAVTPTSSGIMQGSAQPVANSNAISNATAQLAARQAAAAPAKKAPAPAPESALDKWLAGDTTYQQQLAEYNQEQQAYNQNYTNTGNQISQNFDATQRAMNNQAALDRMNQQYDFAGRGVLSSGAYATALDQYNTQLQNNMANLVTGENQQNTSNQSDYNNFLRQLTLQKDAAKQDAISRRAALLGITS